MQKDRQSPSSKQRQLKNLENQRESLMKTNENQRESDKSFKLKEIIMQRNAKQKQQSQTNFTNNVLFSLYDESRNELAQSNLDGEQTNDMLTTKDVLMVHDVSQNFDFNIHDHNIDIIDSHMYVDGKHVYCTIPQRINPNNFWKEFWQTKMKSNLQLIKAVKEGRVDEVILLLNKINKSADQVAEVNYCDEDEFSSIHIATLNDKADILKILLNVPGADVNIQSLKTQRSPLHIACETQNFIIIRVLVEEFKANVDVQDKENNTPIHLACIKKNKKIITFLLSKGANVEIVNKRGQKADDMTSYQSIKEIFQDYRYEVEKRQKFIQQSKYSIPESNLGMQTESNYLAISRMLRPEDAQSAQNQSKILAPHLYYQPAEQQFFQKNPMNQIKQDKDFYEGNRGSHQRSYSQQKQENFSSELIEKKKKLQELQLKHRHEVKKSKQNSPRQSNSQMRESKYLNLTVSQVGESLRVSTRKAVKKYVPLKKLGSGSFGKVILVEERFSRVQYALKIIEKNTVFEDEMIEQTLTERNILAKMKHPFIVQLIQAFQNSQYLFLVLEYCPCGDMGDILKKQKKFSDEIARLYICEIVLALEHLHRNGIIFRDLKPENIIICEDGHIKLTDFGLSKENVTTAFASNSFIGTHAYLAPEVLKGESHGKTLDWYNLGTLLYEFLVGMPPYLARDLETLQNNIKKGVLKLPNYLSADAVDLIKGLLQRNPLLRLGAAGAHQVKEHKFFKDIKWDEVYNRKYSMPKHEKKLTQKIKKDDEIFEILKLEKDINEEQWINNWGYPDNE